MKQEQRLRTAVDFVQSRLKTAFKIYPQKQKKQTVLLSVNLTARGTQDHNAYNIYYSPSKLKEMDDAEIQRHVLHELLHAICWPETTLFNKVINHIENEKLRTEFITLWKEYDETQNYLLERSLGPYILPDSDWTTD